MSQMNKIIRQLKTPNTLSRLSFKQVESKSEDHVVVSYFGHEVGGSYVPEEAVTPGYVHDLQYTTNRKVEFIKRTGGFIGSDVYHFKVNLYEVVDPKKHVFKGRVLRADCYMAFEYEGGLDWAVVYILHMFIISRGDIADFPVEIRDGIIYYKKKILAEIVEYTEDFIVNIKGHNTSKSRTKFHAVYDQRCRNISDVCIDTVFPEITNVLLKKAGLDEKCVGTSVWHDNTYGDNMVFLFDGPKVEAVHIQTEPDAYYQRWKDGPHIKVVGQRHGNVLRGFYHKYPDVDVENQFFTGNHWFIPNEETLKKHFKK